MRSRKTEQCVEENPGKGASTILHTIEVAKESEATDGQNIVCTYTRLVKQL